MTPSAPPAVELDRVAHRFGSRWVLRGCPLSVESGEAVALLGGNGAGKTTLLRILCTLLRPTRGGGRVFGRDLVGDAARVREVVGLLGASPMLYEDLTAEENLRFACRMRGERPGVGRLAGVLDEVGLADRGGVRVRDFSSGMRRRVALARILLRPPRLLLLDEPYASFDADGALRVDALVRDVTGAGGAAVIATHDLGRAAGIADRALRLEDGLLRAIDLEDVAPGGRPRRRPVDVGITAMDAARAG